MAKLILKTNLINNTFNVEQKTIDIPTNKDFTPKSINLIISPKINYKIKASDFTVGGLPKSIKSILFNSSNNNVVATVHFNSLKILESYSSLYLPISGRSSLSVNSFILKETMLTDNNVYISESNMVNPQIKSRGNPTIKEYNLSGNPGSSGNIMVRRFTLPNGYYFKSQPIASISGPGSKYYSIASRIKKDDRNRIIEKDITIKYTFPLNSFTTAMIDNISFSYQAAEIKLTNQELTSNTTQEPKIYSIDTGANPDMAGGHKFITVKGVPGTPFRILVQDGDKNIYDFETGLFSSAGGKMLEGVIPPANPGVSHGLYREVIAVPSSSTGVDVTTRLMTDEEVDHDELAEASSSKVIDTIYELG